jgi:hypothetical protein
MSQVAEQDSAESFIESQERRSSQEPIQSLAYFSSLVQHAAAGAKDSASQAGRFAAAFHAECIACGIRISGEQLLKLATNEPAADEKLARLQQGYCARRTCESRFYQLTCWSAPGVDWKPIFEIKDGYASGPPEMLDDESSAPSRKVQPRYVVAVSLGLVLMILMGVAWQLYAGGAIPLIRPAEKFVVDPDAVLKELSRIE